MFFSDVLADLRLWIRFLRKEAIYHRAPSLDAVHGPSQLLDRCAVSPSQFTLPLVALWLVVPGVARWGCPVPCGTDEPERLVRELTLSAE